MTAIGTLISTSRATTTDDLFFTSSKTLIREFISLGYTKTFLRTVAQKAITKEQSTRRWYMLPNHCAPKRTQLVLTLTERAQGNSLTGLLE